MSGDRTLRVAMVGRGFMGAAHSQGWRTAPRFFDLPAQVEMAVVVGRDPAGTEAAREKYGWQEASTDWRATIARATTLAVSTKEMLPSGWKVRSSKPQRTL